MGEDDVPGEFLSDGDQYMFETEYAGRPPSIAIVEALSAIEGVQPTDIDFTLYESINPNALDTLFGEHETDEKTSDDIIAGFSIKNYNLNVNSNGILTIKAPEETE